MWQVWWEVHMGEVYVSLALTLLTLIGFAGCVAYMYVKERRDGD